MAIAVRQSIVEANRLTLPLNLLVGIQDRGQISCHKVVVIILDLFLIINFRFYLFIIMPTVVNWMWRVYCEFIRQLIQKRKRR